MSFFIGTLTIVACWEVFFPRRKLSENKWLRWVSNLGIVALNTIFLRMFFSAGAVGFSFVVHNASWGIFNKFNFPYGLTVVVSVILLDLAIYFQHIVFHHIPILWRLHRMHHTDLDFDVTTGSRFHPFEIMLSMLIKFLIISLLGAPALAVIIFEVILNATAMFNHGNIYIPLKFDRVLRLIVVTPDVHRVHHSIYKNETNSNFGFNVPWWDRLFGTYRSDPVDGHEKMTIGIDQFRSKKYLNLPWLLIQPFLRDDNRDQRKS